MSEWLFGGSELTPHGYCLLWEPALVWTYAIADAVIALAYFSIPLTLVILARRRRDLVFRPLLWLFAAFILLCGTTHWLDVVTLWSPLYALQAVVKTATAIVSIITAASVWWYLPTVLALPSPVQFREANAALLASREQLFQAQKMEAVGQLTGGIAHDFNNLLQVITGSLRMIERHIARGSIDQTEPFITAIRQASGTASSLINRLLAFSRRQALKPSSVEPDKLVASMEEMIRRILGPEIRLDLRLGNGQWNVICDASQLESALLNLSINARDAMPLGGVLRIATTDRKLAADDVPGQAIQPGNYVEIEVADNGRGMCPETLARAFEPFFTTKPSGQGTGLGLSQTYGFVTQSGGALLVESTLGEGTTVRIYLPGHERTREPAPLEHKPTAETIVSTGATLPHRRVLVVEDQDAVRFQIAAALNEIECTTIQAGDGQKGLELLQSGESLDLLITDVGMPGLNGRELADAARAIQPDLPILFITGYAGKVLDSLQFAPGMDVLRKPFSLDELVDRVRALLAPAAAQKSL